VGLAYIGRWDELEPSDQTDHDQRLGCNPKAVEDPMWKERADMWFQWPTDQGAWLTGHPLCQVGPPSVGRLLVSSRFF
jgi:hypothetical protein